MKSVLRLDRWLLVLGVGLLGCAANETDKKARKDSSDKPAPEAKVGIEDLKVGSGPEAKTGDFVLIHYTGRLTDGAKFGSSLDSQEPVRFRIGFGEMKGWDKGLLGMKVGGKRKLTVEPPEPGSHKKSSQNPAEATVIFEIDLLRIE